MAEYRLAPDAEEDLQEIARYTVRTWGWAQAERYLDGLERHFVAIGDGTAVDKQVFEHRVDLRVSRYRHHYVFFAEGDASGPIILAVFHESMDLVVRLRERLGLDP